MDPGSFVHAGPSDDPAPAPAGESGMDCDIVYDKHDLKQLLDPHGQSRAMRQAATCRYEDIISFVSFARATGEKRLSATGPSWRRHTRPSDSQPRPSVTPGLGA